MLHAMRALSEQVHDLNVGISSAGASGKMMPKEDVLRHLDFVTCIVSAFRSFTFLCFARVSAMRSVYE